MKAPASGSESILPLTKLGYLGRRQGHLLEGLGGRRLLGDERQLQVTDDPVDDRVLRKESDDLHPPAAAGTNERVDFINLPDHLGPALGSDGLRLLLDHPQGHGNTACLPDFPPVRVGVEPVITDHDLALVRDPGDEFMAVDVESRVPPG